MATSSGRAFQCQCFRGDLSGASPLVGLLFMLLSSCLFCIMSLCVHLISKGDDRVSPLQTVVVRFVSQFGLSALTICWTSRGKLRERETWMGKRENFWKLIYRGGWGIGGLTCWFLTLSSLNFSDATAIVFLNVPLTAVFAHYVLKEPFTRVDLAATLCGLLGVLFVSQPSAIFGGGLAGQSLDLGPVAVAILGACSSAMAYVSVRRIGPGEKSVLVVLTFSALGTVVTPFLALVAGAYSVAPSARVLGLQAAVGFTGFAGQLFMSAGLQSAPAAPASAIRYTELIFALLIDTTILANVPDALKLVGCLLIMSTVGAVVHKQRLKARKAAEAAAAAAVAAAACAAAATEASALGPQLASPLASPTKESSALLKDGGSSGNLLGTCPSALDDWDTEILMPGEPLATP